MISIGSLYYLIPRLFGEKEMYSVRLIELHFWIATIGVVLYIASMWIAGVMEGLMWRPRSSMARSPTLRGSGQGEAYPFYTDPLAGWPVFPFRHVADGVTTWRGTIIGKPAVDARSRPALVPPPIDRFQELRNDV
ncbi:cbb3-type cytochrome c oxidase subunit I [Cupriavidus basilensis]